MGFFSRLIGQQSQSTADFVDLDTLDVDTATPATDTLVYEAEITGQGDLLAVKDAIYDGNIVIAEVTYGGEGQRAEHVMNELRHVTEDIGGDIARKSDGEVILTPAGVGIGREKLKRD